MRRCGLVSTNPLEIPVLSWDLGYGASVTDRALKAGTIFRTRIFGQFQVLPARRTPGSRSSHVSCPGRSMNAARAPAQHVVQPALSAGLSKSYTQMPWMESRKKGGVPSRLAHVRECPFSDMRC